MPALRYGRAVDLSPPLAPVGERIATLLQGADKTPAWLAEKTGLQRSTVTRAINGNRQPSSDTLQAIATVLGLTVPQLVAGTDAAGRVNEVEQLVPHHLYDNAVHQIIAYESKANEYLTRIRNLEETLEQERARRRVARGEAEKSEREADQARLVRDDALRKARHFEQDAIRYRNGLEKAVKDVERLNQQLRELGAAVEATRRTGQVGTILAGVAAAVSIATYLGNEPLNNHADEVGKETDG
ncbi:MAG: helix-turn-helix domain-containing protein [Myxococcaceae bacterium]|nr:MAG: helix-turn-helix domain-containing protein [Myxococcaceae bacterium]